MTTSCLVVMDNKDEVQHVFISNQARDLGLHNAGLDAKSYKEEGWKTVIGTLTYEHHSKREKELNTNFKGL